MTNKGTILVVDDTPANLRLMVATLETEGYRVHLADSGELALASLSAGTPDLILLDILMPEMDGFEVYRRLRALEAGRDIPVMFISALSDLEQRVEGLRLGAVDFITKPFQREELLARVHTHLELRHLRTRLEHEAVALQGANDALRLEIAERQRAEAEREQLIGELQTALPRSRPSPASSRSAPVARRSATTRGSGARSRATSPVTPLPCSVMESARTA